MKLLVKDNYDELSEVASNIIIQNVQNNPNIVLGLSTGSTPIGVYTKMVQAFNDKIISFSNVKTFNLDEYIGVSADNINSYQYYMNHNFFQYVDIKSENCYVPSGNEDNNEEYCLKYEQMISASGGIDLLLLGIGENGHIAFNEPNTELNSITHVVNLSNDTIQANSRFFKSKNEVPKQAITMGVGTILKSKKIILLASGNKKSKAINRLLTEKKISTEFPASFLLCHSNVTVIIDKDANIL